MIRGLQNTSCSRRSRVCLAWVHNAVHPGVSNCSVKVKPLAEYEERAGVLVVLWR